MKLIKIIFSTFILFFLSGLTSSCNAQSSGKNQDRATLNNKEVKVYYFHFTRRCATCMAVEEQSRLAIESLYPEQIEEDLISFEGINIEEEEGGKLARELGISGQALLIVNGDQKMELTNEGFLYANSYPDKLKQILKQHIDPLLFQ